MNVEEEFLKLKSTVRQLKDRQDIFDCIQRESRARDRQDVDMIESCWWEDGVDEHGPVASRLRGICRSRFLTFKRRQGCRNGLRVR